jgi:divalent metal cation (Fe/Co/Zn/Cd) transporter
MTAVALTAEQRGRERALLLVAALDGTLVGLLLLVGELGGSLTCIAEALRGGLVDLIALVSLMVMRRLHRGTLTGFDFGTGKIEQLCSLTIAAALGVSALWVGHDAIALALSERSDATPLALTLAAMTGALNVCINVVAWDEVRRAARGRPSAIMHAQLRSRWTKLLSSLTVQATMTLAAVAKDPMLAAMADAVGALLVCVVMAFAARDLLADSLPDLLDRSMDPLARPALEQAMAALPDFALAAFRSRGTARAFVLEVALACPAGTEVRALAESERRLAAELRRLLPDVELSLIVRAQEAGRGGTI